MNSETKPSDPLFIWLDDGIEISQQSLEVKKTLSEIVKDHLQTFADPNQCVDSLTDDETKRIFLIVSNKFGHQIVPLIYEVSQIEKIYVYCRNREIAEKWAKPELKVAKIFTRKQDFLDQIREDMSACVTNESVPLSVLNTENMEKSLKKLNDQDAKFMWYQAMLKVLLLMAKHCNAKEEMIKECRSEYKNNPIEQRKIDDFEQTYTSSKAFWWYTYNSFVFRLLNQALRSQDTEVIFNFRFFIHDLDNQIKQHYMQYLQRPGDTPDRLTFYRGQFMRMSEIELLQNNVNQIISMNSFFSATVQLSVAEIFAGPGKDPTNDSLYSVLMIIDACDFDEETAAFAFIQKFSCSPHEEEVLFTINAIFRIEQVTKRKDIWNVYLRLEKHQDELQRNLSDYMMKQLGPVPGPTSFGWFLYRMCDLTKAERYAKYITTQYPPNNEEIGHAYNLLGLIYKFKGGKSFKQSIECFQKALDIYSRLNHSYSSQIVAVHYNIALVYIAIGDDRNAKEHQEEIQNILNESSHSNNPLLIAMNDRINGKLFAHNQDYQRAYDNLKSVYEKKRQVLPPYHQSLATALNDMGIVQEKMGQDDLALENFGKALEITSKSAGNDHFDLAEYHTNIGRIHHKRADYERALDEFNKALKILNQSTREESSNLMTLLTLIKETEDKLRR